MHSKKVITGIVALCLASFSLAGCSSEGAPATVDPGADGALVIDGEIIADADLFAAAKGGNFNIVTALSESTQASISLWLNR